mgnify:CR=1 FL=1
MGRVLNYVPEGQPKTFKNQGKAGAWGHVHGEKIGSTMQEFKARNMKKSAPGTKGGLNAEIQARIGHQLRAMYDDVVRQGVPDRFAELIKKLDEAPQPRAADEAEGRD